MTELLSKNPVFKTIYQISWGYATSVITVEPTKKMLIPLLVHLHGKKKKKQWQFAIISGRRELLLIGFIF